MSWFGHANPEPCGSSQHLLPVHVVKATCGHFEVIHGIVVVSRPMYGEGLVAGEWGVVQLTWASGEEDVAGAAVAEEAVPAAGAGAVDDNWRYGASNWVSC